jgi:hypothetical protein
MTRDRDIERVLDRFYAEGPSEMPDRLFLGVFDRIERVPQRRLAHQMTRFASMNTKLRLAAAAIVVALVGVGAFAISQRLGVGNQPTPSPTAAATFEATSLPAALRSRWVGEPRVVPQAPEPPIRNALVLSDAQLGFALVGAGSQKQFASVAALTAPDQIRLRGATTDGGCQPGDEGTYAFKLSELDTVLTFTTVADACGPRAAALAGDWVQVGCSDDQGWCLGDLPAGTHTSVIFTPLVAPASWTYSYGRFSYSVPAGWTNGEDCAWCYTLAKQGAPENTGINIWTDAVPHAQADQCSQAPEPGVGRTADAITTWLTTLPGLVTTAPAPVTIGGLNGKLVDLSVAPTWTASCPYAYSTGLPLVSTFSAVTPGNDFDWNIQGAGRTRIVTLDLGNGQALVIDIEAQNQADFDALLPEAMQVVNSFQVNR